VKVAGTPAEIAEGGALFSLYCGRCHDPTLNLVRSGAVPDLRRSTAETHEAFEQIVRGGIRRTLGMPSFADDITADQVRQIHAYVVDQARLASAAPASH
jgi:quinohemoprotein ethanol dehydrogenase